jgi:hypothetical protein
MPKKTTIQTKSRMKKWVRNNLRWIVGGLAGAVFGYVYWRTIGCENGSCMITGKWHNAMLYFAISGALLFSMFQKKDTAK